MSGEVVNFLFLDSAFDTLEKRLVHMNKLGIDKQVITAAHPTIDAELLHISSSDTVRLAKVANDSLAAMLKGAEDRFIGVAEVPMLDSEQAIDELKRSVEELGMKGVQINTTIAGKSLDSNEFRSVFRQAARMNIPIFIHPCNVSAVRRRNGEMDFGLHRILGWPFETSLAVSRLVFGGMLEESPSLKIITHHAGAMIPFFANRIDYFYSRELSKTLKLGKKPSEYFGMVFYDTATEGSKGSLDCARDAFGVDRMVFGTDYPFRGDDSVSSIIETINGRLDLSEEEREKIFCRNATRVLGL